jgi:hypothetical protein
LFSVIRGAPNGLAGQDEDPSGKAFDFWIVEGAAVDAVDRLTINHRRGELSR